MLSKLLLVVLALLGVALAAAAQPKELPAHKKSPSAKNGLHDANHRALAPCKSSGFPRSDPSRR